ncbi:MAG: NADH-quinone oxidoreductase subunit L, partial [Gammaproteobacteria bacterium]|nr:NADH-quinone oxidoreductase subunit L [Gammaproteobacteria bacterium]
VVEQGHGSHADDPHAHREPGHLPHLPKESPWVVTLPLILLAIPSLLIGWPTIQPLLYGNFFGASIYVAPDHHVMQTLAGQFHGTGNMVLESVSTPTLWIALSGVLVAWIFYMFRPAWPGVLARVFKPIYELLVHKFYFDEIYAFIIAGGARGLGGLLWKVGDTAIIDGGLVNGSARVVGWFSRILRRSQSGYLYHYAFAMIIGLSLLLGWLIVR